MCVCIYHVYISLMCDYAARHVRRIWNNRRIARFAIRFALRWCPCAFATRHFSVLNQKSEVLAKSFSPVTFAQPASTPAATLWTGLTFWICILIPFDYSWLQKGYTCCLQIYATDRRGCGRPHNIFLTKVNWALTVCLSVWPHRSQFL